MTTVPYGSWPSPITARLLVEAAVGLSDLSVTDGDLTWAELRPNDGGRSVPVRWRGGGPVDLIPAPFSARSSVHEYGGRPFVTSGDTCWFVNFADQRIWSSVAGGEPTPLTPEPPTPRSVRFGDLTVDRSGGTLFAVRERHGVGGVSGVDGVVNDLVSIATDASGAISTVASGHDFFSSPRLSPDGRRLAYLAWDHPAMPWDESVLYAVDLDGEQGPRPVAGGTDESISQPRFSGDGTLHYLSDRSGYTSLYREDGTAVVEVGADLGGPDWVFGLSSYDLLADGSVVIAVESPLGADLTRFSGDGAHRLTDRFDSADSVHVLDGHVAALAGSATEPTAVVLLDPVSGSAEVIRASRAVPVDERYIAVPEAIAVQSRRGEVSALYYPPTNPDATAPDGELPPLVVISHGGPTSRTTASFNLRVQFFTSRGFAVVDVNYGGSSGFGKAYRERLDGAWGVVDVEDCVAAARFLSETGRADPARLAIRGGSAGGYTTLCALTFTDAFAVGASHYGISDLSAIAADTHKFESHYTDRLVGPLPQARSVYDERSPLLHADGLSCPVIFFQGLDDFVVPPRQAEVLVEALRRRSIPVVYLAFEGEGHGFRRAETIITVAEAELTFFGEVLGFTPATGDDGDPNASPDRAR